MKKIFLLTIFLLFIPFVFAVQTVKTIELPLDFVGEVNKDVFYMTNVTINPPDGVSEILAFEIVLKGDFLANTNIIGEIKMNDSVISCEPDDWSVVNKVDSYDISLDCSDALINSSFLGGDLEVGFMSSKTALNIKPYFRITYLNNPRADITISGTYYEVGDSAKIIAQLSEDGVAINNASCYASVFTPSDEVLFYNQLMTRISDDGLYVYNFPTTSLVVGVYPVIVNCDYVTFIETVIVNRSTYFIGSPVVDDDSLYWFDDDNYSELVSEPLNGEDGLDFDLVFLHNLTHAVERPHSNMFFQWGGYSDISDDSLSVYWYNFVNDTWDLSESGIDLSLTSTFFYTPNSNFSIYINETSNVTGETWVKINGSFSGIDESVVLLYEDFENNGTMPSYMYFTTITPTIYYDNYPIYPLFGDYSFGALGDYDPNKELGYLYLPISTVNSTNISVSYWRETVGSESTDSYSFEASYNNGSSWEMLESWNGNSGLTLQNFTLNSSYDNNSQVLFRYKVNFDNSNDVFKLDEIMINGFKRISGSLFSDFIYVGHVDSAGVVNEIRGGGELNIKDRLSSIEDDLDTIIDGLDELLETKYQLDYSMPDSYSPQDTLIVIAYLHEIEDASNGLSGANCTVSFQGVANSTGLGEFQLLEVQMVELGGGKYYYVASGNWSAGIYTFESNCEKDGSYFYATQSFRMESDFLQYLTSILDDVGLVNDLVLSSYVNLSSGISGLSSGISSLSSDLASLQSDVDNLDQCFCSADFSALDSRLDDLEDKLDLVLEKLDIVVSDINLVAETFDCLEGTQWRIEVIATDNFGNYLNSEDINCNITTSLWGTQPMVWVNDSFDYEHICQYANQTINWGVECEEI